MIVLRDVNKIHVDVDGWMDGAASASGKCRGARCQHNPEVVSLLLFTEVHG